MSGRQHKDNKYILSTFHKFIANHRKLTEKFKVTEQPFPYLSPWVGPAIDKSYKLRLYQLFHLHKDSSTTELKRQRRPFTARCQRQIVSVATVATVKTDRRKSVTSYNRTGIGLQSSY